MKKALFFISILLTVASCKKENNDPIINTNNPPSNQFTDSRDGKTYSTVTIGTQVWMAENLNYGGTLSAGSSYCYNNTTSCNTYGKLYDWEGANAACPSGYHLPTDEEWKTLEKYLGMTQVEADELVSSSRGTDEGTKLKEGGTSGFNAKMSGYYNSSIPQYENQGTYTIFWTSTLYSTNYYYTRALNTSGGNSTNIFRGYGDKNYRNCIRCLKN